MQIKIIVEPSDQPEVPFASGPERYHRFAAELGRCAGTAVAVERGPLRGAPADTYILLAGMGNPSRTLGACSTDQLSRLRTRLVLLDVGWKESLKLLEQYRLVGAVDSLRMSEWLANPSGNKGPFGLRYLAHSLQVDCSPLPWFQSERYCRLDGRGNRALPELLADYLAAYDRDRHPLSSFPSLAISRFQRNVTAFAETHNRWVDRLRKRKSKSDQEEVATVRRLISGIKAARQSAQMTISQLAAKSGLDAAQVDLLEGGGYQRATLGTLRACAQALGDKLGWQLTDSIQAVDASSWEDELFDVNSPSQSDAIWKSSGRYLEFGRYASDIGNAARGFRFDKSSLRNGLSTVGEASDAAV